MFSKGFKLQGMRKKVCITFEIAYKLAYLNDGTLE